MISTSVSSILPSLFSCSDFYSAPSAQPTIFHHTHTLVTIMGVVFNDMLNATPSKCKNKVMNIIIDE